MKALVLLLSAFAAFGAPIVVGPEARLSLPTGGEYGGYVNYKPATNEICTLNPPLFSWGYRTNALTEWGSWGTSVGPQAYSEFVHEFRLRVSTNSDLSSPAVDVRTRWPFYNFVPAITNGSDNYLGTIYWRVDYFSPTQLNTSIFSFTRTFTLASDAVQWDRSYWGTTNAWLNLDWYPRLWFAPTNRQAVSNSIIASNFASWVSISNIAVATAARVDWGDTYRFQTSTNSNFSNVRDVFTTKTNWVNYSATNETVYTRFHYIHTDSSTSAWTTAQQWTCDSGASNFVASAFPSSLDPGNYIPWAAQLALAGEITRLNTFTNRGFEATKLIQWFRHSGYYNHDWVGDTETVPQIVQFLDWSIGAMTAAEKASVMDSLDAMASRYLLKGNAGNGYYVNALTSAGWEGDTNLDAISVTGFEWTQESHTTVNAQYYFDLFLLGAAQSTNCSRVCQFQLNFLLSRMTPYTVDVAINQPRGYAPTYFTIFLRMVNVSASLDRVFPNPGMKKWPQWLRHKEWFLRWIPPKFVNFSEAYGEGSLGGQTQTGYQFANVAFGEALAYWLGDGESYLAFKQSGGDEDVAVLLADTTYKVYPAVAETTLWRAMYSAPAFVTNSTLAKIFSADGWAFGNSQPYNLASAFTNGIGFVVTARPAAMMAAHASPFDMRLETWAYGANVTDNGGNFEATQAELDSIFSNGTGFFNDRERGNRVDNYGRIIAFTNSQSSSPSFTYIGLDGTQLFSHELSGYSPVSPRSDITNVQRHVLFVRNKYFVVGDRFDTTTNTITSLLYHVRSNMVSINTNGISWLYYATNWQNNLQVSVLVAHVSTTGAGLTNMTGANERVNPITGASSGTPTRQHCLWVSKTNTSSWFMHVIYPLKWDNATLPTITRLSDYSVAITNGSEGDVISFDETNALSTLVFLTGGTQNQSAPAAPTSLAASPGNQSVTLTWGNPDALADGIHVQRDAYAGGSTIHTNLASSATSWADSAGDLANGTLYVYIVTRTNTVGSASDSVQATPTAPASGGRAYVSGRTTVGVLKK